MWHEKRSFYNFEVSFAVMICVLNLKQIVRYIYAETTEYFGKIKNGNFKNNNTITLRSIHSSWVSPFFGESYSVAAVREAILVIY